MRRRSLSTGIMLLALLLGALGNVLVAACPHMGQDHACCHAKVASHPASHQGMDGMQMDGSQTERAAEQSSDDHAFDQPVETCEHCMGRSQLPAPPAALREADQSKRSEDVTAPPASPKPISTAAVFTPTVVAREHAPPSAVASARHVLISVFRI